MEKIVIITGLLANIMLLVYGVFIVPFILLEVIRREEGQNHGK